MEYKQKPYSPTQMLTGSLCSVVPSLAPGSSSPGPRKCQQKQRLCLALLAEILGKPARHFSASWKLACQTAGENGTFLIILPTTRVEKGHLYILTKRTICWPWLGLRTLSHLAGLGLGLRFYCVTCLADAGSPEQC